MADEATGSPINPQQSLGTRAVGNAAMLLAARVGSRLIALVTVFATANSLGPGGNGQFQTTVLYTSLISILVDLGFNAVYTREGARDHAQIPRYLRNILSTRALFAVPALAVLALAMNLSSLGGLLLPAFLVMLLSAYSNVLRSTFYATGTLTYEAVAIGAEAVVLLAGTLYGVLTHRGVDFFLWCYAASYAFSTCYFVAVITLRRMVEWRWELDVAFLTSWFRKSLPFALGFVISTLYFKIDVPILLHYRSFTEVGWYTFAYKPVEALLFIPMTVLNVAFPVLSVYHTESADRVFNATSRFFKALMALGWPLTVGVVMLAPGINGLFDRSGRFGPAAGVLEVLGAGIFLMFVTFAFTATINAMDRQVLYTWAAVVSLVVNLALNLFLIPAYGSIGAALATDLTELALLVTGWLLLRRILRAIPVFRLSWRIVLAGLVMGVPLIFFRDSHGVGTVVAILVGVVVYGAGLLVFRVFEPAEIALARRAIMRRG